MQDDLKICINAADIYLIKVIDLITRIMHEIYSKLTTKTAEQRY